MPHGPLSRSAGVAAYGDFYILGGQTSSGEATDKVEILDGNHRKWFSGQPMPKKASRSLRHSRLGYNICHRQPSSPL